MFFIDKNLELYRPSQISFNVSYANYQFTSTIGKDYAIIDLDGTLCSKGEYEVKQTIKEVLAMARKLGQLKDICVLSNLVYPNQARKERLINVASQINAHHVAAYWPHLKPRPEAFLEALKHMGAKPDNTIVIGDQLLTDIYGGNLLGMYTILVPTLSNSDHPITKPKRMIEKQILKKLNITVPKP